MGISNLTHLLPFVLMTSVASACARDIEPQFQYTWDKVCEDILGVAATDPPTEEFLVFVDHKKLGLTVPRTMTIALTENGPAQAWVNVYPRLVHRTNACSDVMDADLPEPAKWPAVSGVVTVTLTSLPLNPAMVASYRAEFRFEGLVFRGPRGQLVRSSYRGPIRGAAGWSPG